MQIAENLTAQSLAQAYGTDPSQVKEMVRKVGDYGDVAVSLRNEAKNKKFQSPAQLLTLDSIVEAAKDINALTGDDSVMKKVDLIGSLCQLCQSDDELRFLVRSFANTGLRMGLSTKSVEKCIIEYFTNLADEESDKSALQRLQEFEKSIFGYRIQSLSQEESVPIYGVPVKAMVGKAAKSPANVLETLGKNIDRTRLVADHKYDGERTHIHHHSSTYSQSHARISLFSRNFDR